MKTLKFGLLLAFISCSVTGPLREDPKAEGYKLGKLPKSWVQQDYEEAGADVAYLHTTSKTLLSVHSVCDRYVDSKLETLSQDLLSPLKAAKVLSQEDLKISDRRALLTVVEGTLDGVPVKSHLVVLRKNRCLFDFSIFGTALTSEDRSDFLTFVNGFHFEESSK